MYLQKSPDDRAFHSQVLESYEDSLKARTDAPTSEHSASSTQAELEWGKCQGPEGDGGVEFRVWFRVCVKTKGKIFQGILHWGRSARPQSIHHPSSYSLQKKN